MKNTLPNIRFNDFDDIWVNDKLIDCCDYVDYRGKTPAKTNEGIFLVTAKNVKTGYIDYNSSKEYISEDDYDDVMHRGFPEKGDVLITTEAPCGNVAQVDREDIALAQRIIKYRGHKNKIDNTYLKHYLLSPAFQEALNTKSSGGTVQGIKGSILHQQIVEHPSFKEQSKIGSFLDTFDKLITFQNSKVNDLKEVKKYMLQKMFPKDGASVPEIRFAGYTDAWVQRKVGDLAEVNPKSAIPDEFEYVDLESVVGTEIIAHRTESRESAPSRAQRLATAGDVFYQTVRPYQKNNCLFEGADESYVFSTGYAQLRPVGDSYFLLTMLQRDNFVNDVLDRCTGTSYPAINANVLADLSVSCPVSLQEQEKIGRHFKNLDNLITLHQRKCDDLREVKKYMLQNMFP